MQTVLMKHIAFPVSGTRLCNDFNHTFYSKLSIQEYYCNIIIWTMYILYQKFYLISVYKLEAANTV